MAKFLLRDGNKISANIDPSTLEMYKYKDRQGIETIALLSARSERQLLKTIPMSALPIKERLQFAKNRISD